MGLASKILKAIKEIRKEGGVPHRIFMSHSAAFVVTRKKLRGRKAKGSFYYRLHKQLRKQGVRA